MANTSFFLEFENIYRKELISQNEYKGCEISKEKVQLSQWGKKGFFECDVVIKKDGKLLEVQCLSCSEYKTKNGKNGNGKLLKIKADALMLSGINCKKKSLVFLGKTMYEKVVKEQQNGRFPKDIELKLINLCNKEIFEKIKKTSEVCSSEMIR